jgi:hypothetical protein
LDVVKNTLVALLVAVLAFAVFAQEKPPAEQDKILAKLKSKKMGVAMIDAELGVFIWQLSANAEVKVVLDPDVDKTQRVSFEAENDSALETMRMVLEPCALDYVIKKDGSIFISTLKKIVEMRAKSGEQKAPKLKPGEILLIIKDNSRIRGRVKYDKWTLETAYGALSIPLDEITGIRLAGEHKAGRKKKEEALPEDEITTARFTVTGNLKIDKVELTTDKGTTTITKENIRAIIFPEPLLDRWFQLKPTDKWVDTGIKVRKGDRLEIRAGAAFIIEKASFNPDGQVEPWLGKPPTYKEGCPLITRIGKKGREFKTGKSYKARADEEGNVYLKIHIPTSVGEAAKKASGAYSVRIRVNK